MTQENRKKLAALIADMDEIKGQINALQSLAESILKEEEKPRFYYGDLPGYAYE